MCAAAWAAAQECNPRWGDLAGGTDQYAYAAATLPNGDVVVGGRFDMAGGVAASGIARWDGHAWHPLGEGVVGGLGAMALTVLPNGDLIAGGQFIRAGGEHIRRIARWDGSKWHPLGEGVGDQPPGGTEMGVYALLTLPNGDVIAGGHFRSAGGAPAKFVARWDGSEWSPLGDGLDWAVDALTLLPNGDIIAGGRFGGLSTPRSVARWDGTTWHHMGAGMRSKQAPSWVSALATLPNGDVIAGGHFHTAGGVTANGIARWDGTEWHPLGTGMETSATSHHPAVESLAILENGDVIAGGNFITAGGVEANYIARWDGEAWHPIGRGTGGSFYPWVEAMTLMRDGSLVAAGQFWTADELTVNHVAVVRWDCSCPADCDGDTELIMSDFLCFQEQFGVGAAYADCDDNGIHDFFDFLCFQDAFAAGCP